MALTCDAHIDAPWRSAKHGRYDLRLTVGPSVASFPYMKRGNLDSAFFALYVPSVWDQPKTHIRKQLNWIREQEGSRIVFSHGEATTAHSRGLVPIFLGLEGGGLIEEDLNFLKEMAGAGVRYLTVTHNYNTSWADSATDVTRHGGLTKFGRKVVGECYKLGILLDVSHASDSTAQDVIEESWFPVIATHSGCRARAGCDHPRNLPDHLIKNICWTGGIVCIPFVKKFVGPKVDNVIAHIDHAVNLVGPRAVGIGSDLDGAAMVEGMEDASCWKKIPEALSAKGYNDAHIEGICGGNLLRLL